MDTICQTTLYSQATQAVGTFVLWFYGIVLVFCLLCLAYGKITDLIDSIKAKRQKTRQTIERMEQRIERLESHTGLKQKNK